MAEGAGGSERTPAGGRRRAVLAAVAWVASVVVAGVLGAWSFAHTDPGGGYERTEALSDTGVRHELAQEKQRAAAGRDRHGADSSSSPTPGSTPESGIPDSSGDNGGSAGPTPVTVRFPGGAATATAQCAADGRVRLPSLIPADGYSVDEADRGPARTATVELEPADDDADDVTVAVRCAGGRPHATLLPEDGDDD